MIDKLMAVYSAHPSLVGLIVFWLFSNVISTMPPLTTSSSAGYTWLYNFLHLFAGNIANLFQEKISVPTRALGTFLLVILLLPMLSACHGYVAHVGAPNVQASEAYDSLIAAQGAIDQAKINISNGALSPSAKPGINAAIRAYQIAKGALKSYSDAVTKGQPSDVYFQTLTADLTALGTYIAALRGVN